MSTQHDPTITEVAGNLYGALMDARPYVERRIGIALDSGNTHAADAAEATLTRVDCALAEAADYLGGVTP